MLTYASKPESSRIVLASPEGEVFHPLDSSLDGRIFAGTRRFGVVAFEPFSTGYDSFHVLFELPAKKGTEAGELRVNVTFGEMSAGMAACLEQPSILEQMTERLAATQSETHTKVNDAVAHGLKQASKGCMVSLAVALLGAGLLGTVVVLAFG